MNAPAPQPRQAGGLPSMVKWTLVLVIPLLLLAGLVVGGVVAYRYFGDAYRYVDNAMNSEAGAPPPPPSEKVPNAPGPDNTVKQMPAAPAPAQKAPNTPGPDNTIKRMPDK